MKPQPIANIAVNYCDLCGFPMHECLCYQSHPNDDAIPVTIYIPDDIYNAITDIADDNGQSVETTILAALDKVFSQTPVLVPLSVDSLGVIYFPSGKSVADILPGKAKSARIEVLL